MSQRLQVVGDGGAVDAERRRAEVTVDQDPVEQDVGQVGNDDGDDDGPHFPHRLQRLPEDGIGQEREDARNDEAGVAGRPAARRRTGCPSQVNNC